MNVQSFILKTYILKSNHANFEENKINKIIVQKNIGEGSYGLVFLIENDMVIKIFKDSTYKNVIFEESNYLIPIKNENRELIFYYKYINENNKKENYIINLCCIGIIKNKIIFNSTTLRENSYFVIIPYCIPFYDYYKIKNKPLINNSNGFNLTLKIMKRLIEIIHFFENKYNLINLDIKLNNFMFSKKTGDLNDLIMIDFSMIKIKSNIKTKIKNDNKYYLWSNCNNMLIDNIPSYSICISGLELLFGYSSVIQLYNNNELINIYLKIIKKTNKNMHNIFFNGLILKINTNNFLKLFNNDEEIDYLKKII